MNAFCELNPQVSHGWVETRHGSHFERVCSPSHEPPLTMVATLCGRGSLSQHRTSALLVPSTRASAGCRALHTTAAAAGAQRARPGRVGRAGAGDPPEHRGAVRRGGSAAARHHRAGGRPHVHPRRVRGAVRAHAGPGVGFHDRWIGWQPVGQPIQVHACSTPPSIFLQARCLFSVQIGDFFFLLTPPG